ncbi:MAG: ATP-binding protein [Desulfuromonadia bacterium]
MNFPGRYLLIIPLTVTLVVAWFISTTLSTAPRLAEETLKGSGVTMAMAIERLLELDPRPTTLSRYTPRDLAYASVTDDQGTILFHSNPVLVGTIDTPTGNGSPHPEWSRVRLGTGEWIYRLSLPVNPGGKSLHLTLGLHTYRADEVIRSARGGVTIISVATLLLWGITIAIMILMNRLLRQREELDKQREHARLGQMAAVMAHEIRNPLAGIKGFAQLIAFEESSPRIRKHADKIVQQSVRLEHLVDDLLSYARIDDAPAEMVDLSPILDESVALMESEARAQGITIFLETTPTPPVAASRDRVMQILLNLMKNALQAMPEGGNLTIGLREKRGNVFLTVSDTGCGIPPHLREKIFEPFWTSKTHGTGLGLPVCRAIMERLGGSITLESKEGLGTTVTLRFPMKRSRS